MELNKRRAEWVTGYLGKEYEFGDLTTKMARGYTCYAFTAVAVGVSAVTVRAHVPAVTVRVHVPAVPARVHVHTVPVRVQVHTVPVRVQVRDFTGNTEYKFGDITKTAVSKFTGKDEYEFGDVSKKLGQMLFGNKQVCALHSALQSALQSALHISWGRCSSATSRPTATAALN